MPNFFYVTINFQKTSKYNNTTKKIRKSWEVLVIPYRPWRCRNDLKTICLGTIVTNNTCIQVQLKKIKLKLKYKIIFNNEKKGGTVIIMDAKK